MTRGRAILSSVLVALGAIAYGASPIDIIPELLLGPIGLADDLAVWVGAGVAVYKLLTGKGAGATTPPPSPHPPTPSADQPRWEQKAPE